jgi:predicted nucleotidyltransferase
MSHEDLHDLATVAARRSEKAVSLETMERLLDLRRCRLPSWLTPEERSRLDRFSTRVRALLGPDLVKFCLFGSRARGEGHAESDLDVLLVLREATEALRDAIFHIDGEIFEADGYPLQGQISPLIMSEADWLFTLDRELLIGREITEQGIPL